MSLFARDFLTSKTTWTGIIGIVAVILTQMKRPDLVQPVTGVILALEGIFIRDGAVKAADRAAQAARQDGP